MCMEEGLEAILFRLLRGTSFFSFTIVLYAILQGLFDC